MFRLRLFLFGLPRLTLDDQEIKLSRRKSMALLLYLAVTHQASSRDTLAAMFWPEADALRARANLRNVLLDINRKLGAEWLTLSGDGVTFNPIKTFWLDVGEFLSLSAVSGGDGNLDRLSAAVDLYQADFLSGFTIPDSPEFDLWQSLEARFLSERLITVFQRLVRGYESTHLFEQAVTAVQRWIAHDPLNEDAHLNLIRLYASTGQRHTATRHYHELEQLLRTELGVSPSAEVQQIYTAIMTGSFVEADDRQFPISVPVVNLPPQPTRFLGRQSEIAQITRHLQNPECHLLTLTGPGGIGKTRAAIEAASHQAESFPDGVFFVSLASINTTGYIVQNIATAVNSGSSTKRELLNYLQNKTLLLVVDNFEHLLDGREIVSEMIQQAEGLKILVTSREKLSIPEEWLFDISGMTYPTNQEADQWESYEAVQLFLHTARRSQPKFTLDSKNKEHILRICHLTGGIPLAVELAASWVNLLSCAEIAHEIEGGMTILQTTMTGIPERHRSMRVVLEQSWRLLTEPESAVFQKLAVFQNSFSRHAAEHIAGASLFTLAKLLDKSMIRRSVDGRYEIHELLKQYASEKLSQDQNSYAETRSRHCRYFADFLWSWALQVSKEQTYGTREIQSIFDDIQGAWHWVIEQRLTDIIGQIALSLRRYYDVHHWHQAGSDAIETYQAALDSVKRSEQWIQASINEGLGELYKLHGQRDEAQRVFEAALELIPHHDAIWRSRLQRQLGDLQVMGHQHAFALEQYAEAEYTLNLADSDTRSSDWWREWSHIQVERLWLYYWTNRYQDMAALDNDIGHLIDQHANPRKRLSYMLALGGMTVRRDRYYNSTDSIKYTTKALELSKAVDKPGEMAWVCFLHGFAHLWIEQLGEAEQYLLQALQLARHQVDRVLETRALVYLTILYRKRHQVDKVKLYAEEGLKSANQVNMPEYIGTSKANMAWLAWHEGSLSDAQTHAKSALRNWEQLGIHHASVAFMWTALFPLMAVAVNENRLDDACHCARAMLQPPQQRLPPELTDVMQQGIDSCEIQDAEAAYRCFTKAIEIAHTLAYL